VITADASKPLPLVGTLPLSTPVLARAPGAKANQSPQELKLRQAAGQFESMLLSNLWKSMKGSFSDDDADYSDPAHSTLDDFGVQALCGAVGKAGGLGIANLIIQNLEPKIAPPQSHKNGSEGGARG
jgi:Rod binding domain-containing protein